MIRPDKALEKCTEAMIIAIGQKRNEHHVLLSPPVNVQKVQQEIIALYDRLVSE